MKALEIAMSLNDTNNLKFYMWVEKKYGEELATQIHDLVKQAQGNYKEKGEVIKNIGGLFNNILQQQLTVRGQNDQQKEIEKKKKELLKKLTNKL